MTSEKCPPKEHFDEMENLPDTDSEKGDPKARLGTKKMGFDHIPASTLVNIAPQMATGAVKYGKKNWIRTDPAHRTSVYYNAIVRHLTLFMAGQDKTSDSSQHHFKAILSGISVYLDALRLGTVIDDRVKYPEHYIEQLEKELDNWEYPDI